MLLKHLQLLLFLFLAGSAYSTERYECIVTKIVDGDTLYCDTQSESKKVRLIGVNTPEMNTSEGIVSKQFVESRLTIGDKIKLELDVREYGPYKGLLVYVYLSNGVMLNELLVKEGYAQVATYPPNVRYLELFTKAEQDARMNKRGLWELEIGE